MGTSPITLGVGNGAAMRLLLTTPAQRATPPAQDQPPGAGEAEFVICDQAIEAIQRILKRRALDGQQPQSPEEIGAWFEQTARGWNRQPTPFVWSGKRRQ